MAFANYTDLQTSVANWLHRADLTTQIPDFIAFGEFWLARDLRVPPLIASNNLTIAAGGDNVSLPALCMEVFAVRDVTTGRELRYVSADTYNRARTSLSSVSIPLNYTVIGASLYVAPAWSSGGSLAVNFFRKEPQLSVANPTNWYLLNAPDCLLYASLLQGAQYIKDAPAVQAMYDAAVKRVNAQFNVTNGQ